MKTLSWAVILLLAAATWAFAELDAEQIIQKSKTATQSSGSIHKIVMTLINKRGDRLVRKMVSRTKTDRGMSRSVTTFLYPEETKGTKFLNVENPIRDDDMKIFIPDLKKIRIISSAQRRQSYMGTDFAYGDLEVLNPDEGEHLLLPREEIQGHSCYKIETRPDPKKGSGYSKMLNWIRTDNFVAIRTEYFDKDGELKKVKTIPELYEQDGIWVMKKMIMKNVQKNHQTIIEIIDSRQKKVDEYYFTDQFLLQTDKY